MDTNDIFEPNHLDSNNRIVESYYDQDSDCSQTSSSSNSSQSSNASQASTQSLKKAIPWKEVQTFTDLSLADQYVEQMTSTTQAFFEPQPDARGICDNPMIKLESFFESFNKQEQNC